MEVQPPWASELLARNRKVARNICWSTSLDSSGITSSSGSHRVGGGGDGGVGRWRGDIVASANGSSHQIKILEGLGGMRGTMVNNKRGTTVPNGTLARDEGKVVDPVGGSSSSHSRSRTEKSVPIQDEVAEEAARQEMKDRNSGEESFLEYGPGIVRKLRTRYQSLALRQSAGRPTLRRSTSLENLLDSESSYPLTSESPSPVPYYEDEIEGDGGHGRNRDRGRSGGNNEREFNGIKVNNTSSSNISNNNNTIHNNNAQNNNGLIMNRGRTGAGDYSRRDRMRRARSVDVLSRGSSRLEEDEQEILEKFRTVVSPKEEIVIIEVSKPRANHNYETSNYNSNGIEDNKLNSQQQQHLYPRSLHFSSNNGYSSGNNSSELNRGVRSVTSPEHELPPPDIVRETARIFEKNHDNHQHSNLNSSNPLINHVKKVGHALRLSKSSNISPSSSPLPSPTAPTTNNTSNTPIMNGQPSISYQNQLQQNKAHLLSQGSNSNTTSASTTSNKYKSPPSSTTDLIQQREKNFTANNGSGGSAFHSTNNNISSNCVVNNIQPPKQVGVIRPTVTTAATPGSEGPIPSINGIITNTKFNGTTTLDKDKSISSSGGKKVAPLPLDVSVSPILNHTTNNTNSGSNSASSTTTSSNKLFQSNNKPALSPKPLFTSSPKNYFLVNNNKTGTTTNNKMIETSNAKSPEEPINVISNFDNTSRVKSPTEQRGLVNGHGNTTSKNIPQQANKSFIVDHHPSEKENDVMEFQSISLKPIPKNPEHSEILILTNGTTNNISNTKTHNSSSGITKDTNKPNLHEIKTEKKDERNNNANRNTNNSGVVVASVPKTSQQNQAPTKTTTPSTPVSNSNSKSKDINKSEPQQSVLRAHQKQKMDQKKTNGGNGTMVFNFVNRKNVPDYIEDDGLHHHRVGLTLSGTVTDESQDDDMVLNDLDQVDSKLLQFVGANVIINGRSSIQKKPKSQKLNISFNEDATTTFEYPSEASVLGEDDVADSNKDNLLGHKTPNVINTSGSGLGSYTPSSNVIPSYTLGSYADSSHHVGSKVPSSTESSNKKQDSTNELIEDYLKPDTGSTTWSNEIGADILF